MKRHKLGRFIENKSGSSFLSPLRRSRHLHAQMSFFAKSNRVSVTKGLGSPGGQIKFL